MRTPQSHTALEKRSHRALEDLRIPVQAKLAAAWTSFMFLCAYVDIIAFFKPGVIDDILAGKVFEFDVSQTLLTTFLALMAIPIFMVVLSMTLPARANRITNLIVASVQVPYTAFNVVGESWTYFYGLSSASCWNDPSRLHPALRLDLATPHRITGDPGSQPRQRATPHAAAGVTARPAPDHPSLAPPAGTVTCLSVRC